MKAGIVAFTEKGFKLSADLKEALANLGYQVFERAQDQSLSDWLAQGFKQYDAIVFVSATGIAVRSIAPLIQDKRTDPAILVIDHGGNFVISLLSGHIGGANQLAIDLAQKIGGQAVVTTASDVDGRIAIDEWAVRSGLVIDDIKMAKVIAMDIIHGKKIGLVSDIELGQVDSIFDLDRPEECDHKIVISYKDGPAVEGGLKLIAKRLVLGIGCRRGVEKERIHDFVSRTMEEEGLDMRAVEKLASIDLKKEEAGLVDFAKDLDVPFVTYSSQELLTAPGDFPPSEFVASVTGVDNVCQRAAVLASDNGKVLIEKRSEKGVTLSVCVRKEVLDVK